MADPIAQPFFKDIEDRIVEFSDVDFPLIRKRWRKPLAQRARNRRAGRTVNGYRTITRGRGRICRTSIVQRRWPLSTFIRRAVLGITGPYCGALGPILAAMVRSLNRKLLRRLIGFEKSRYFSGLASAARIYGTLLAPELLKSIRGFEAGSGGKGPLKGGAGPRLHSVYRGAYTAFTEGRYLTTLEQKQAGRYTSPTGFTKRQVAAVRPIVNKAVVNYRQTRDADVRDTAIRRAGL